MSSSQLKKHPKSIARHKVLRTPHPLRGQQSNAKLWKLILQDGDPSLEMSKLSFL